PEPAGEPLSECVRLPAKQIPEFFCQLSRITRQQRILSSRRSLRPFIAFCPGVQQCSGFRYSQTAGFVRRPFARKQLLPHRTHPTETHLRRISQFHNLPRTQWSLKKHPQDARGFRSKK